MSASKQTAAQSQTRNVSPQKSGEPTVAPGADPAQAYARATALPQTLTPQDVLSLQRSAGNQAVQRLLASRVPAGIQPKLTVGPVNDRYEQEADRVAAQVLGAPPAPLPNPTSDEPGAVAQRTARLPAAGPQGGALDGGTGGAIRRAQGSGHALDKNVRQQFEPRFGVSFEQVRVHTDARSDTLNRALAARAFTSGKDIFFSKGQYKPHSGGGQQLLAHELTHVVQQGGAQQVQRWPWSKKDKNKDTNKDTAQPNPTKASGAPYSKLVSKFMPGADQDIDRDLLAEAQGYAGSIGAATPDYSDPTLADQEPDQFTVTLAVAQEEENWWEEIKAVKSMAVKKLFQSPKKLVGKIRGGEAEQYLLTKVVKKRKGIKEDSDVDTKDVDKLEELFHSVGHVWVRLSTYVGGKVKELYSFGFWPLKTPNEGGYEMNKYVAGQVKHPDTVHESDDLKRYYDKNVTRKQFQKALNLAQERYANPPTYHLLDYNCTKFGKEIMEAAGRSYPGKAVIPSIGFSPGALFASIGDRMSKNKKGKKAYAEDPLAEIVKSVNKATEGRADAFDPDMLGGSGGGSPTEEAQTLVGLDPADYPAGVYKVPITRSINLPASTTPDGDYSTNVEYWPMDGEVEVFVEDDLTQRAGRGRVVFFSSTFYIPLDQIIQVGARPDRPASSGATTTANTQPTTASTPAKEEPVFIEEITLTSHCARFDENNKDLGGSIRPGDKIGITGVKKNGLNQFYWNGNPYYLDDAWWDMYFGRPYPLAGARTPSVSLGPEEDETDSSPTFDYDTSDTESYDPSEEEKPTGVDLPFDLTRKEVLDILRQEEWEMPITFGWINPDDLTDLNDEQIGALSALIGVPPDRIKSGISSL